MGQSNKKGPKVRKIVRDICQTTNHINYQFRTNRPNLKWYADYTYVKVGNKWNYVGFVKNGFDNRIISSIVTDKKTTKATNKLFRYAFNNNSYIKNKTLIHNCSRSRI